MQARDCESGGFPFRRVGIVGVGLIGGSLGLALKRAGSAVSIVGVGRNPARLAIALEMGAIDEAATDPAVLSGCDLVVLATPVDHILSTLPEIVGRLAEGTVLTDVGSTKRAVCRLAAAACADSVSFVGGHPIAGREVAGVECSVATLFDGAPWILCPAAPGDRAAGRLQTLVETLGARPFVMSPDEHDELLARISHLPQILSTVLGGMIVQEELPKSGGGLRDMLRLAASPYPVWRPILETNKDNIDRSVGEFIVALERFRLSLREGDVEAAFSDANRLSLAAGYCRVRPERPNDGDSIRKVHLEAFPASGEALLVDALRATGKLLVSLVAEVEGRVVGHVAFSPVTLDAVPANHAGVGLAPVAVMPAFQRRGIGGRLVRAGLEACRQAGHGFVVVLGDPVYYRRFGFVAASRWGLRDEYGGGNAFMAMELTQSSIPSGAGLVRYSAEFGAVEDDTGEA